MIMNNYLQHAVIFLVFLCSACSLTPEKSQEYVNRGYEVADLASEIGQQLAYKKLIEKVESETVVSMIQVNNVKHKRKIDDMIAKMLTYEWVNEKPDILRLIRELSVKSDKLNNFISNYEN